MISSKTALLLTAALLAQPITPQMVSAEDLNFELYAPGGVKGKPGGGGDDEQPPVTSDVDWQWMHDDVIAAHANWTGVGSYITVVDDYSSGELITGRLVDGVDTDDEWDILNQHHGDWTSQIAGLVAPGATVTQLGFGSETSVTLHEGGLDVINLSYGLIARAAFAGVFSDWSNLGQPAESVMWAASGDLAFIAKSAGNDGGAAVSEAVKGKIDVFGLQLIGLPSAIFVGALEANTETGLESIASYSTIAGSNPDVQAQFLVVGVEGGRSSADELANYGSACGSVDNGTCLYGTSFAAPIVAGYAAILGQKFPGAAPSQVADQLLTTAREDTILNYDISVHGQGEASLSLALSPTGIN